MSGAVRRWLATVLVVLVVASGAMAGIGAASHEDAPREDGPSHADDVYVDGDGNAVLVYGPDASADTDGPEQSEFGFDVAEGLVYGLVANPVEGTPDVRGRFSATAAAGGVDASGSLSAPQPDFVESLDVAFSGEATSERSRSDLTLEATFLDESGMTQLLRSASTSGEVTTTASTLRLTGEFQADPVMAAGADQHLAASLREGEGSYTLSVERNQPIGQLQAGSWENRSVARESLEARYGAFATSLGGNASISVDSLSLTESDGERSRLDVDYTVTFRGIDEGLGEAVREALSENPSVSADQADRLANELGAATVDEASFTYDVTNGAPSANVTVELSEYDGLLLAYLDLAGSIQDEAGGPSAPNVERYRAQLEAQRAANLEQRVTWNGNLTHPDDESVQVEFGYHARTENWGAYVEELEARDVPRFDSVYDLTASSDGERISVEGSMELSGEDLFEQLFRQLNATTPAGPGLTSQSPEPGMAAESSDLGFAETVAALRQAEPRTAKVEGSYDGDGPRVEFGATFENLAALRDELAAQQGLPPVSEAVSRMEDDGQVTYVRVQGAVDADPSAADVRELSGVGEDTTVHLPGEWDREFPTMDTDRAESFLADDGTGGSLPGFGPVVAVVALLATGLLVRRLG